MNIKRHYKSFLTRISPKLNVKLNYRYYYKRTLNLENPQYFDEKIQWLKLNEYHKDIYSQCADKFMVREYVIKKGLENILNPLINVYQKADEIIWSDLPNKFVLKWNFGNGFNIICKDKTKLKETHVNKKLANWGKTKSHLIHAEMQYKNIPKKIICEKFIEGKSIDAIPEDFKVYCFNGVPMYILVCEGREVGKPKFYFFDTEWNLSRINKDSIDAPQNFSLPKPRNLDLLLKYSEKLAEDFFFVRVDFYITEENIYFGELTFSPSGGFDICRLPETDLLFGKNLRLPNDRKN